MSAADPGWIRPAWPVSAMSTPRTEWFVKFGAKLPAPVLLTKAPTVFAPTPVTSMRASRPASAMSSCVRGSSRSA